MESIDYFQRMIMESILSPDDPRGFARSHCLGVRDFESEKFSAVFKTSAGASRFVSKKLEAA